MTRFFPILFAVAILASACGADDYDWEPRNWDNPPHASEDESESDVTAFPFTYIDFAGDPPIVDYEGAICSLMGVAWDDWPAMVPSYLPQDMTTHHTSFDLPLNEYGQEAEHYFTNVVGLDSEDPLDFIEAIEVFAHTRSGRELVGYAYYDETCEEPEPGVICPGATMLRLITLSSVDVRTDEDFIQTDIHVQFSVPEETVEFDIQIRLAGLYDCE